LVFACASGTLSAAPTLLCPRAYNEYCSFASARPTEAELRGEITSWASECLHITEGTKVRERRAQAAYLGLPAISGLHALAHAARGAFVARSRGSTHGIGIRVMAPADAELARPQCGACLTLSSSRTSRACRGLRLAHAGLFVLL
jgi:hypothetical protein